MNLMNIYQMKRQVQFQTQKKKAAAEVQRNIEPRSKQEGSYPVKRVQSDPYSFWCVPCNKRVRCDHQGLKDVKVHCERESHKMVVAQSKTSTVFRSSQLYVNRCHKSRGSGYKFLDTT